MSQCCSTTETGGPPRFGHLRGLVIRRAPGRAEILPYMVGRSASVPVSDPKDPFQKAHSWDGRGGVDARVLLTSNLTLNATVNPDFGQVEVDPAVVNLSAFETFFEERRPFFVEGAGYFGFGSLNCYFCSNVSSLGMFYTRRIGRPPQAPDNVDAAGGVYADQPQNTTILGAAKLTGRTPTGWSIGALDAVTRRERAAFLRSDGSRGDVTVEPFTNYFVARVAKDLRGGATVLRAIGTSVVRELDEPFLADRLSRHAESFGLGTEMWFGKRDYRLMAQLAGTQVAGDTAAMLRLQTSSARYFQRPDRPADAAVRLYPAAQLLGHQRVLDPPPERARRPPEPQRPGVAPPRGGLLEHERQHRFSQGRRAKRRGAARLQPRR